MIYLIIFAIFILSFLLAIRQVGNETEIPEEVKGIKINKKESLSGVILFLKHKIIHHSTDGNSEIFNSKD
jgi:hypothetical protein